MAPGFTKCSSWERLKAALQKHINNGSSIVKLKEPRNLHVAFVCRERRGCRIKSEVVKKDPQDYLQFVLKGADQRKFALPHFTNPVKEH